MKNLRILSVLAPLSLALVATGAAAQTSSSDYTSYKRYDQAGRVTGTITPAPDNNSGSRHMAVRTTYDAAGRVIKVESGYLNAYQADTIAPENWSGFAVRMRIETDYDAMGRKIEERVVPGSGANTPPETVTQFGYDALGRPECTAVRMNPAVFSSLPVDACALGTEGGDGPDRITRNSYDAAGQLLQIERAVGTPLEQDYATYEYHSNGQIESVTDANGNRAEMTYDTVGRQTRWYFPSKDTPGQINSSDYEEYAYDDNGNRISLRKRDGSVLEYDFDALNRMVLKEADTGNLRTDLSADQRYDVAYTYNLQGLQTEARFVNGSTNYDGVTTTYDGFGRVASATTEFLSGNPTLDFEYDANGNRTRIEHPDGKAWAYTYDQLNRFNRLETVGRGGFLVRERYNSFGELQYGDFYSSVPDVEWSYDNVGRLNNQRHFVNTADQVEWSFTRNPASQILTETRDKDNDTFAWDGHVNVTRDYTVNGLNQYTNVAGDTFCHDDNGNLIYDGDVAYLYDVENRLVELREHIATPSNCAVAYSGALIAQLHYDPMGRLTQVNDGSNDRFMLYDGDAMVGEYSATGTLLSRYVHGPAAGVDDPLVWYESTTSDAHGQARLMLRDPRGSIVYVQRANSSSYSKINTYDEYGIPGSTNEGRFQYTGQVWLDEIGMYYYKARIYSPTLGRFLQTDPIGYEDNVNLYAYTGNDPLNLIDFTGKEVGDRFKTPREAGVDAVESANPESIGGNIEAGGSIEREVSTTTNDAGEEITSLQYYATDGSNATGTSISVTTDPETSVGDWHTHGDYSEVGPDGAPIRVDPSLSQAQRAALDQYAADQFSNAPGTVLGDIGAGDIQSGNGRADLTRAAREAYGEDYVSVLGTPSGAIIAREIP